MGAGVDRLVINRRPGPTDFPARFAGADTVMLEKRRGFHGCDGPVGTVLTIATVAKLRETFLRDSNPTGDLGADSCRVTICATKPSAQLIFEHAYRSLDEGRRNQ